jgi:hypothetical protein
MTKTDLRDDAIPAAFRLEWWPLSSESALGCRFDTANLRPSTDLPMM